MNGQTVPFFDPQGKLRDVPAGDANRALASGGQKALLFKAPDGKQRWVPESQKDAAVQAKGILLDPATSLPDFTPYAGEGRYSMTDKAGKTIGIPYSLVRDASQSGYRMTDPAVIRKYVTDAAADPNLKNLSPAPGVRVVGKNAAGQPILAPEGQEGGKAPAWQRFVSSTGQVLSGAAKGLYHGVADEPTTPEEVAVESAFPNDPVRGRAALIAYRTGIAPSIEQGKQAVSEFKKAGAATPWTETRPSRVTPQAYAHRQLAAGHALAAALPVVGPWAAQVGEQVGTQVGSGDIAGAAGTAAGNVALYAAPHAIKGAARLAPAAVRTTAEALTSTGPRELKKLAEQTIKANTKAAEEAAKENAAAAQRHLEQTQEALHKTRGTELTAETADKQAKLTAAEKARDEARVHQAAVEEVRQHNDRVMKERAKRQQTQQKLDVAGQELQQKIEAARAKAKAADDAAWDTWRNKVGTAEIPSDAIVDQINASKSVMDPEDVAEFRKVLKETKPAGAEASELQSTRDSIAKQNGLGKSYDEASPENKKAIDEIVNRLGLDADEAGAEAAKPVNAQRLHVWKTQLEYAVRHATRGNVRYAIGQVLDRVRDTETNLSETAEAGKELADARALHGPYKDTFVNPPTEPRTVAGTVQAKVAPEFTKEAGLTKQIEMLGNYDPSIPQLATHIDNLREGLAALPKEAPLREQLKPLPPPPEPVAKPTPSKPERVAPPERPTEVEPVRKTISPEDLRAHLTGQVGTAAEELRRLGIRRAINALFYTTPAAVLSTLLGHPGWALTETAMAPVILVGSHALANLLDKPEVAAWIGKVTASDVAAFEKLPPTEKAVFTQNLRQLVEGAEKKKIAISPLLTAFVAGSAATAKTPKTLKQLREEAQQRQQKSQNAEATETTFVP